jgi:hypothetical protein
MGMQEGIQRGALNSDKGMNTGKFLRIVLVFLIAACVAMWAWTRYSAATGKPNIHPRGLAGDGTTALDKGGNR